jgi:hypothetical protein
MGSHQECHTGMIFKQHFNIRSTKIQQHYNHQRDMGWWEGLKKSSSLDLEAIDEIVNVHESSRLHGTNGISFRVPRNLLTTYSELAWLCKYPRYFPKHLWRHKMPDSRRHPRPTVSPAPHFPWGIA